MTPRAMQIIAHLQRAQSEASHAANLLLQELAEVEAAREQTIAAAETQETDDDG